MNPDLTLIETLQRKVQELSDSLENLSFSFWKKTGPASNGIQSPRIESANFKTGVSGTGWAIDSNGNAEFNNGNFRGDITGATGTFSGTVTGGALNIPDSTTANSMHVDSSGNTWWGANVASGYASSNAQVLSTGAATFKTVTISGATTSFVQVPLSKDYVAGASITAADAVYGTIYQSDGGVTFDAKAVSSGTPSGGVLNIAFSVGNNANRVLLLVTDSQGFGTANSATYNGVSMTAGDTNAFNTSSAFILVAPDTGSHTLAINTSTNNTFWYAIYSYYNCKQTSVPDNHAVTGGANNRTLSMTPVADGSLVFGCLTVSGQVPTTITQLANNLGSVANQIYASDSGILSPISSQTIAITGTLTGSALFLISLAPFTAPIAAVKSTSASAAATSNTFLGFALASATAGNSVTTLLAGEVPGFTGLSLGSQYYLSNSTGLISTTAGSVTRKVGIATSTTSLLISNIW